MEYYRLKDLDIEKMVGSRFIVTFIAFDVLIKDQKDNKKYMEILMKDNKVMMKAKIFAVKEETIALVKKGGLYTAVAEVKDNPKYGLSILMTEEIEESKEPVGAYVEWVENLGHYNNELSELIHIIKDSVYGKIAIALIQKNWERYSKWAAGKSRHHNILGALLMHSVCVAKNCLSTSERYCQIYGDKFINKELLVSAALIHDIGKTKELDVTDGGSVDYTVRGSLIGHITDCVLDIKTVAEELGLDTQSKEVVTLMHCILAHHGKREYGSPVEHSCVEAYIIHLEDDKDAMMWHYAHKYSEMNDGDTKTEWENSANCRVIYKH